MLSPPPSLRPMLMLTTDTVMVILDMLTTDTTDTLMPTTVTTATITARDPLMLSPPLPPSPDMDTTAMDTTDIPMPTTVTTATTTARDPLMLSPRPLLRLMLTTATDTPTTTDMLTTD